MEFKIEEFIIGEKSSFYTLKFSGEEESEIDRFICRYKETMLEEIEFLLTKIKRMADETGCQDYNFKISEGMKSDNICALHINNLRLYCLRYGNVAVILGDGGIKGEGGAYQNYPELLEIIKKLEEVCKFLDIKIKDGEISFSENQIIGNLDFTK